MLCLEPVHVIPVEQSMPAELDQNSFYPCTIPEWNLVTADQKNFKTRLKALKTLHKNPTFLDNTCTCTCRLLAACLTYRMFRKPIQAFSCTYM